MKIVHFSDWHGEFPCLLPPADLYICTGDMIRNYDISQPDLEKVRQDAWILRHHGRMRSCFGNHDAPVVCVRGNHDFTDIASLFGGDVSEIPFGPTRTIDVAGLKVGGFRGVPPISGYWSDEMWETTIDKLCIQLPRDLDVIVAHTPPYKILDNVGCMEFVGSKAFADYLGQLHPNLKLVCFGHIHEEGGHTLNEDGVIYSNAAETYNEITL